MKLIDNNPNFVLSIIPNNVICLEDVKSYLSSKCETISSHLLSRDMDIVFNQDMSIKPEFDHLKYLDLIKYHFYRELDVDEWTQVILSRVHNNKLWMGENIIYILADLIHEVTGLRKKGSIPIRKKMVKKKVEQNTKAVYNGKAMIMSTIKHHDVIFVSRIITSCICGCSKTDELLADFIHAAYKICVEKEQVNLSEIMRIQLVENLEKIKKTKNSVFRFQSLINHVFFHVLKRFPFLSVAKIMSTDKCTMEKVTDVWRRHHEDKILESRNLIMKTFQNEMRTRFRIAPEIVDRFKNDICVMMDTNQTYIEAVELRENFIDPLGYEVTDNVAISYIDLLLNSEIDKA